MNDSLKLANLLFNLHQMGIKNGRIEFSLEHYDSHTKYIVVGILGNVKKQKIEFFHRIGLDMFEYLGCREHEESFLTEKIIRHLLDHIIMKVREIE